MVEVKEYSCTNAPWLELLAQECRQELQSGTQILLDLSKVTYVGPSGIRLLRKLTSEGIQITKASSIMIEMLGPRD